MSPSYISKLKHTINKTRRRLWLRGGAGDGKENDSSQTSLDGPSSELDEYGFELITKYPTSLDTEEFYDNQQKVESIYYDEISKLICDTTGASYVHCIYHNTKKNGSKRQQQQSRRTRKIQPCNSLPALKEDSTTKSCMGYAADALESMKRDGIDVAPFQQGGGVGGRHLCIKVWRNISPSKIGIDYYLSSTMRDRGAKNPHSDTYCVSISRNDVLLFKEYDSDPTKNTAKMGFCASFGKTTSRLPPPPRESIEVYCIAFFPNSIEGSVQ